MLHMTHFLKLLDMMCKDEVDPASIVEDTEPTRFRPSLLTHASHRLNELTAYVMLLWDLWWFLWFQSNANVVNTGEYSGQVGSVQSHLMKTTDQWPLTGRALSVSPSKCLEWKEPSWVFQLLSPGKVPKNPLETRLEATPVKSQRRVLNFTTLTLESVAFLVVFSIRILAVWILSRWIKTGINSLAGWESLWTVYMINASSANALYGYLNTKRLGEGCMQLDGCPLTGIFKQLDVPRDFVNHLPKLIYNMWNWKNVIIHV